MPDTLEHVLRLVAEGRITAEEAAPILDALGGDGDGDGTGDSGRSEPSGGPAAPGTESGQAKAIRIEVSDKGRNVVNLRIPIPLGRMALDRIPGLAGNHVDLVREALAEGRIGPVLVLDDDGDGVRIAIE
jgi:hypothetical protein